MAKRTLWRRICDWFGSSDPEKRAVLNPLLVKIGNSAISVRLGEYTDKIFQVSSYHEVVRHVNDNKRRFVDYHLDEKHKLRLYDEKWLIFNKIEDFEYDRDVHEICKSGSEFVITDHDKNDEQSTYFRIGDDIKVRECKVFVEGGKDYRMDYWDYSRIAKDVAGQKFEEFLLIEMDSDSGRITMWLGESVDKTRVTVF